MSESVQAEAAPGRRSIASNTVSLLTARGASAVVAFFFGIYVARALGVREFGSYSILMAAYTLLSIFVHLGMDSLVVREISRAREETWRYFRAALRVKLTSAVVCLLLLGLLPVVLPAAAGLVLPLILIGWALILDSVSDAVGSAFQAHERFTELSLLALGGSALFALLGSAGLFLGGRTTTLVACLVAAKLVQAAAGWVLLRKQLGREAPPPAGVSWRFAAALLAAAAPFFVSKIFAILYLRIDMLMLGAMAGEQAAGLYAAGYKFVNVATTAAASFSAALFPVMTASGAGEPSRFRALLGDSLKSLLILGTLGSALTWALCAEILVYLFGDEFAGAAPAARILAWAIAAIFLNLVLSNALLALNRERFAMFVGGAALAVNLGLNLVLIPVYREEGAATATLIAEAVVLAAYGTCLVRAGALRIGAAPAIRFLVCVAALVAPVVLGGQVPALLTSLAGAVLFLAALFFTGILTPGDLYRLRGFFAPLGKAE